MRYFFLLLLSFILSIILIFFLSTLWLLGHLTYSMKGTICHFHQSSIDLPFTTPFHFLVCESSVMILKNTRYTWWRHQGHLEMKAKSLKNYEILNLRHKKILIHDLNSFRIKRGFLEDSSVLIHWYPKRQFSLCSSFIRVQKLPRLGVCDQALGRVHFRNFITEWTLRCCQPKGSRVPMNHGRIFKDLIRVKMNSTKDSNMIYIYIYIDRYEYVQIDR